MWGEREIMSVYLEFGKQTDFLWLEISLDF